MSRLPSEMEPGLPAAFWVIAGKSSPCTWLTNCWFYACKLTDNPGRFYALVWWQTMYLEFYLIRPFLLTF